MVKILLYKQPYMRKGKLVKSHHQRYGVKHKKPYTKVDVVRFKGRKLGSYAKIKVIKEPVIFE